MDFFLERQVGSSTFVQIPGIIRRKLTTTTTRPPIKTRPRFGTKYRRQLGRNEKILASQHTQETSSRDDNTGRAAHPTCRIAAPVGTVCVARPAWSVERPDAHIDRPGTIQNGRTISFHRASRQTVVFASHVGRACLEPASRSGSSKTRMHC